MEWKPKMRSSFTVRTRNLPAIPVARCLLHAGRFGWKMFSVMYPPGALLFF